MKMAQKHRLRKGKRKYTTANADSSEMAILPSAITMAVMKLTIIMRATGGRSAPSPPPNSAVR